MSSGPRPLQRPSANRTRQLVGTVIAVVLFVVAVLGLYFNLPLGGSVTDDVLAGALLVAVAVVLLVLVYLLGLRRAARSLVPVVRVVSLLVMVLVTFAVIFASVYLSLENRYPGQIPGLRTDVDSLYFTVTMLTTVGFGDISPTGQVARVVATVQMLLNVVFLGFVLQIAVKYGGDAAQARARKRDVAARGGREPAAPDDWQTGPPGRSAGPEGDA